MIRFCSLVALVSLALFATAVAPSAQQKWLEYRPPGAGYRIEFPGTPTLDSEDMQNRSGPIRVTYAEYRLGPGATLMSSHSVYPAMPSGTDPQVLLDGARNGGVKGVNGRLREEKRLTVGGMPARLIMIDAPESKRVAVILAVVSGNNLYQAIAGVPTGQENSADIQRFLGSFALVPR